MLTLIFFTITAYLLGSLSSAIIVCKILQLPDPRTKGSKNPGATNVLRIGGKKAAAVVFLGDALKGLIPVLIAKAFGLTGLALGFVGLAAFLGHLFPVFFAFQGGKGVATLFGVMYGLSILLGVLATVIWLGMAKFFRYSSLAALTTAIVIPLIALLFTPGFFVPLVIMSGFLFWRHQENIQRLRNGVESKIGEKNK